MRWIFRVVTVHFIKIEFKLNKLNQMGLNSPAIIVAHQCSLAGEFHSFSGII